MDWCVAETFDAANHNPVAAFQNDQSKAIVNISAKPQETVQLSAEGTHDPDGNQVFYRWFVYKEAGSYNGQIDIEGGDSNEASFVAPTVKQASTIHVILEVKDNGDPGLYSYRRVVITVNQ
jgi:hypothetical protein